MGNQLIAIGEALIDFIPNNIGCDFDEITEFAPKIGGAPANVCGAFSKLGGSSCMLTQLGNDLFGHKILRGLKAHGINTEHISLTDTANTALAFVSLDKKGGREFSFYRKPSADMLYSPEKVREAGEKANLAWTMVPGFLLARDLLGTQGGRLTQVSICDMFFVVHRNDAMEQRMEMESREPREC